MQAPSIHIVRQYGRKGGMEGYVWALTHALADLGHPVAIVCEKAHDTPSSTIKVHELGLLKPKPRWISMLRFSARVTTFFQQNNHDGWVIHSHERTAVHQVTTCHGPSILARKKKWDDVLSPRLQTWEYLERREFCGKQVSHIIPNSVLTALQLAHHYPSSVGLLGEPGYPGVDDAFRHIIRKSDGYTLGFIGKEWQRKGLAFACKLVARLRQHDDRVRFIVAGPEPSEIIGLFDGWPKESYELVGWQSAINVLPKIDLLIHPAEKEPFGMSIAEANASGIAVAVSDQCGIASLIDKDVGFVLPLDEEDWYTSIVEALPWSDFKPKDLALRWSALAKQHESIYSRCLAELSA